MQTLKPEECAEMIREGGVCALSGAGISTAAGIPDFRGANGLYSSGRYDPDTVFDISYFQHNPKPFFDFSRELLQIVDKLSPTRTHTFLSKLEETGLLNSIVTQNIDPLHQIAGSKRVISVHGNYATGHCRICAEGYGYEQMKKMIFNSDIPACPKCGGVVKPDIVFFGEAVYAMDEAIREISRSRLLLVLGSSLVVYPAASLPEYASRVIVVNKGYAALTPGKERYFIDSDLDIYFTEVEKCLG